MYIHNIPAVFYNYKPLTKKINELIDRGYTSIKTLTHFDKASLVTLIMDSLDKDQEYVLFDTHEFSDNCTHFKNYLKTRSLSDLFKFTTSLEEAAFNKYADTFSMMFDHFNDERVAA